MPSDIVTSRRGRSKVRSAQLAGSALAMALGLAAPACTLRSVRDAPDGAGQEGGGPATDAATSPAEPADGSGSPESNGGAVDGTVPDGSEQNSGPTPDATVASEGGSSSNGPDSSAESSGSTASDAVADAAPEAAEFCPPEAGPTPGMPPTLINFDTWLDGRPIGGSQPISTQFPGVTFTSTDCGGPITYSDGEANSPPNFLVGFPLYNEIGVSPIAMDLVTPALKVGATLISVGASVVRVRALNSSSAILATVSVTHPGTGTGANAHDLITLQGPGIVRVVFEITTGWPPPDGKQDGFGVDDIMLYY